MYNFSGAPDQSDLFNSNISHIFENEINTKTFKEDIASSIQSIFGY